MSQPQATTELTRDDLNVMIGRLEDAITELQAAIIQLDRTQQKTIWIFKVPSWKIAMRYLTPFLEEVKKARFAIAEGNPQHADSRKTRDSKKATKKSTARKKSKRD